MFGSREAIWTSNIPCCLCISADQFEKGSGRIHTRLLQFDDEDVRQIMHSMPMHYFECLLKLDANALRAILGQDGIETFTDDRWKRCLREGGVVVVAAVAAGEAHEDEMALGDIEIEVAQAEGDIVPRLALELVADTIPSRVVSRGEGFIEVTIKFDRYSHSHGHLRAYTQCPGHERCFKYTQPRFFKNVDHCVAWLYEWRRLGRLPPEMTKLVHKHRLPVDADVAACYRDLFGLDLGML